MVNASVTTVIESGLESVCNQGIDSEQFLL